MDNEEKRFLLAALPALLSPPPDITEFLQNLMGIIFVISKPPPDCDPLQDRRYRLHENAVHLWEGRDVFSLFSDHPYGFFQITGETPETMLSMLDDMPMLFHRNKREEHKLSPRNRVLLYLLWIRTYPSYHMLSMIFDVSVETVKNEIKCMTPIFHNLFASLVTWPSIPEWQSMRNNWPNLPTAVGAIDGTSTEIYRPMIEPQQHYYSGHRHYHAIHSQVVIDNTGEIRHIECGFLGHQNDAQQFRLMRQIGQDLPFPQNCVLLGDKIYPNGHPVITPFTQAQIRRKPDRLQRICRKFNITLKGH